VSVTSTHFEQACPVCAGAARHVGLYRKNGFLVGRCEGCGLGATQLGTGFDPKEIYTAAYFEGGAHDGYADYPASEAVLRRGFRRTVDELVRLGCKGGKLLEIGCAYGFFLLEARRRFEVAGIELAPEAAAACRARGLDVHQGPVDAGFLESRAPFDAVVMLDVIEHLEDPAETVRLVASQLRRAGLLLITTGDWGSLPSRLLRSSWRLMTPPQHLFFFTKKTLSRMLADNGFEVVSCRYPWKTVPLDLILYQLLRMCRLPNRSIPQLGKLGLPVNLFDALQLVARKL